MQKLSPDDVTARPPPPQYAIYKSGCAIVPWQCAPANSRFSHPGPTGPFKRGYQDRSLMQIKDECGKLLEISAVCYKFCIFQWLTFLPQLDELGKTVDRTVDDLLSGIRALDDSRIDTTSLAKVKMLFRTCVLLLAMLSTWYGTDRWVM